MGELLRGRGRRTGREVLVKNPLCELQKMYSEEMRKFAAMCGLTIDSRLKAATVAREEIDTDISEEFGDI